MPSQNSESRIKNSESSSKPSTSTSSAPAATMAELMARNATPLVSFKKGESVKGKITRLTKSDIRVDIGTKAEAIVLEKDRRLLNMLMATVKVGDAVDVTILNPESEAGNPIVSLRKYISDQNWDILSDLQQNNESLDVTVSEATKGGYVVSTENGLTGFLPNSHMSFVSNPQSLIGKKVTVSVLELNRKDNKIIVSQKATVSKEDFTALTSSLQIGQKITTNISNITLFGIFTSIPVKDKNGKDMTLDGLIHISELSWDHLDEIPDTYLAGESVEAKIIGFDANAKRVDLSVRQLSEDPFTKAGEKFPVDTKVTGTVLSVSDGGVSVSLDGDTEGFIRQEHVPPMTTYAPGQRIGVTVTELDSRRHKIYLTPVLLEKPIGYR